jgi:tRNA-(ms[2]io[6]A)-hydroxylase
MTMFSLAEESDSRWATAVVEHLDELLLELASFYDGLVRAEARHFSIYVDLARQLFDAEVVDDRLSEISAHEARILADAPDGPRMHNGVPSRRAGRRTSGRASD